MMVISLPVKFEFLAMMVIYLPVKFEFDWTQRFRVRVRKRKCGRTDRQTLDTSI